MSLVQERWTPSPQWCCCAFCSSCVSRWILLTPVAIEWFSKRHLCSPYFNAYRAEKCKEQRMKSFVGSPFAWQVACLRCGLAGNWGEGKARSGIWTVEGMRDWIIFCCESRDAGNLACLKPSINSGNGVSGLPARSKTEISSPCLAHC